MFSISVPAILIAICVLDADFYASSRLIPVVITPAVAISVGAVLVGIHPPIATYCLAVPILITSDLAPRPPPFIFADPIHTVVISVLRSPTGTDPNILGALFISVASLIGLLWRALWLHRHSLGLTGRRRVSLILRE
ncbi:MAG TPA: hypothetical protein VKB08_18770 [Bradyrhizobium sp.]|nr:hypothetical protein [Bradyrhizobium sp.]